MPQRNSGNDAITECDSNEPTRFHMHMPDGTLYVGETRNFLAVYQIEGSAAGRLACQTAGAASPEALAMFTARAIWLCQGLGIMDDVVAHSLGMALGDRP